MGEENFQSFTLAQVIMLEKYEYFHVGEAN